jgi:4-amino-4-deoxy-L-arabinose transferase-like glycosyltransferase
VTGGARWAAAIVAAIVAVMFVPAAGHYGAFRNELYFIVCGRHPAFGYVDQPPVVPLLAALTSLGGVHLGLLRLPAILSDIALIPLVVAFAQLLGASTRGAWLAAIASASAALITAMAATLGTSSFEPFDFTAMAYLIARAAVRNEPRWYWWAGIVGGLAFETRYGILMWVIALAVGIALCGPRGIFRSRDLWIGFGIATVIALPNAIWQIAHGMPFLELVRNDSAGNLIGGPIYYVMLQVFLVNIVLLPLWVTAIVAPFVQERLAPYRFLAVTFLVMLVLVFVTHGKAYYTAGAYPTAFALGAAACTRLPRWLVAAWCVIAPANAFLALPFVLPVMPVAQFKERMEDAHFHMRPMERAGIGAPLMQVFSDEFGWPEVAQSVEAAYAALPPADRAKAAIYATNYGDASAIDVYGTNLPPAISGNNQYYLWGTHGYDGSVVLAVNVDPARWQKICDSAQIVAHFGTSPYAMPYETNRPIVLCRGMHPPLPQRWPQFKHYGVEFLGVDPG